MDRRENKLLTGPLAPSPTCLLSWINKHPSFEVLLPKQTPKSNQKSHFGVTKCPENTAKFEKIPKLKLQLVNKEVIGGDDKAKKSDVYKIQVVNSKDLLSSQDFNSPTTSTSYSKVNNKSAHPNNHHHPPTHQNNHHHPSTHPSINLNPKLPHHPSNQLSPISRADNLPKSPCIDPVRMTARRNIYRALIAKLVLPFKYIFHLF